MNTEQPITDDHILSSRGADCDTVMAVGKWVSYKPAPNPITKEMIDQYMKQLSAYGNSDPSALMLTPKDAE